MKTGNLLGMTKASLLLLSLVFAFAVTSCGDDDDDGAQTVLQGTWVSENGETLIVSGNNFTYLSDYMSVKGTFTLDERENHITMTFNQYSDDNGTSWYSGERVTDNGSYYLVGETLYLDCNYVYVTFYRVPVTGPGTGSGGKDDPGIPSTKNPFVGTWSNGELIVVCETSLWTAYYYGEYAGSGTYTLNGDTATLREDGYNVGTATVSGSTMTVIIYGDTYYNLTKDGGGGNPNTWSPLYGYTQLTAGQWSSGNIPHSGIREQWFRFTATASTQYIHVSFGGLEDLYVQLFNSNGDTVGSSTNLYDSDRYDSWSLTSGQIYYIKVWPFYDNEYGTFEIAFNTSSTAPF
jgi:hypothetical protein